MFNHIKAFACHKLRQTPISTDHPARKKSRRQSSNSLLEKPPGADAIPAEVYKHGGDMLLQKLTYLFCCMWDEEVIPQQLKDASIIRLYKKGNRQLCDNYRGISLLAIAWKILARVLLNRLIVHLEHGLLP